MNTLPCLVTLVLLLVAAGAQVPGVSAYPEDAEFREHTNLLHAVKLIRDSGKALGLEGVRAQLRRGASPLVLPKPVSTPLTSSQLWDHARRSHVRLGWFYQCDQCERWHLMLAGGYLLSTNGVASTAYHVVEPIRNMRRGVLFATDHGDRVFPVTEVLAADRYSDTCLVRLEGENFQPLALRTNAQPGDAVFCYSDALGQPGSFSQGEITRLIQWPARRRANLPGAPRLAPLRLQVTCDWSPGSSGSAVLDEFGNAVGQVSTLSIQPAGESESLSATGEPSGGQTILREAASAADVLTLIRPVK